MGAPYGRTLITGPGWFRNPQKGISKRLPQFEVISYGLATRKYRTGSRSLTTRSTATPATTVFVRHGFHRLRLKLESNLSNPSPSGIAVMNTPSPTFRAT